MRTGFRRINVVPFAGSIIGSRLRTPPRQRQGAKQKKIGALSDGRAGGVP